MRNLALILMSLIFWWSGPARADCWHDFKTFFVNVQADTFKVDAKNPFQSQAVELVREAGLLRGRFYRVAAAVQSEAQLAELQFFLDQKIFTSAVWEKIPALENAFQAEALRGFATDAPKADPALIRFIPEIRTQESADNFLRLAKEGRADDYSFWREVFGRQVQESFAREISAADIEDFVRWDGFDATHAGTQAAMLKRYASREQVTALVEHLSKEERTHFQQGQFYAEVAIKRTPERIRIAVPAINVMKGKAKYGDNARAAGLNAQAAEFMAAIQLLGLREAKRSSGVVEVEFLAQNIVNKSLAESLVERGFHRERTDAIPNYSEFSPSGKYLRLSTFPPPPAAENYGQATKAFLEQKEINFSKMEEFLGRISNVHQFRVVREIINKGYSVRTHAEDVLRISNPYQVRALQAVVDLKGELDSKMPEILSLQTEEKLKIFVAREHAAQR